MKKLLLSIVAILFSTQAFADTSIRLMTEEFAPYQFYEGEGDGKVISGISIEIVQAIQKQIGNGDPIKVLPWSRGLKLLAKHKNSALFSTARTPERENKYKWVGPLAKLEIVFFKKAGNKINVRTVEEAKLIPNIGVTKNVATHEILKGMGFTNLNVMQSGADDKNLKRLLKGRVDVWPTAYYAGIYSSKKMGILDQIESIPDVSLMSGHLYIAFNIETDSQIIHQWQTALDGLKSDGVIDAILKTYDR
jgi:polar amino acid transport system substrate-binding protein